MRLTPSIGCRPRPSVCGQWIWRRAGSLWIGRSTRRKDIGSADRSRDDLSADDTRGAPGMVLKAEPMLAAIRAPHARLPAGSPRICLSAQGELFDAAKARELAA